MDIVDWLHTLNLGQYEAAFRENSVGMDVLPSLTGDDLKDIGVNAVGDRRRLLNAIAALRSEAENVGAAQNTEEPLAERRQLTVMFCDIAGSTALSTRLDPEDLSAVVRAYQSTVRSTISRFGGFIARYVGDGVLIYFGWPEAHETDAESAVRAALAVIAAVNESPIHGERLSIRIGIATGLVVVGSPIGEGDARQQTAIGETPNLAARLQSVAAPNAVVIAAGTRRLVGELFDYRDLGWLEMKGIAAPVPAWQVLRLSNIESRFEAFHGSALTPLVGRDEEVELLLRRWARAKAGDGQVVLISGEAGLGKSRLTEALAERLHDEPHVRLRYFCSPYHQDSALFPFVDQLGRAAGFTSDDPPASKLEKLDVLLARAAPWDEDVAYLADLLSLPPSQRHPLPSLSAQRKKERTLEALIHQLEGLTRQQPVVMVFEDAHWIDPTSRELLDVTVQRVRRLPVLLIVTFRPEFQSPWIGQPQVMMLALNRLDWRDRITLVEQIAGGKKLPAEVIDQIGDRTDGVPLFVEELTKSVLESGLLREERGRYMVDSALSPLAIPTSLHDSLMARLDRLASVRLVAQIGAAIGRQFSYPLLHAVSRLSEDELHVALDRLVASELVSQRGSPPDAIYSFKHALVQDAAHGSLLRSTRQRLHADIAVTLENRFPDTIENRPELLARHYEEAGHHDRAAENWALSGKRSMEHSALVEASIQIEKALVQLALTPACRERSEKELHLQADLGSIKFAVRGWAAPETGQSYARAHRLWEDLGYPSEFLRVPWGQWMYHANRGELDLGCRLAEDMIQRSASDGRNTGLVLGYMCLGATLMVRGEFSLSRLNLIKVENLCGAADGRLLAREAGIHLHTMGLAFLGFVDFCLGYPNRALTSLEAAIAEAQREQHRPSVAQCLSMRAKMLCLLHDHKSLAQDAEQLFMIGVDQGFPYWRSAGSIYQGWVKVITGEFNRGISELREGIIAFELTGARVWTPQFHALQADAELIGGDREGALSLLSDALQTSRERGENWFEAELTRLRGELLRDQEPITAEAMFEEALGIARRQDAKLWELRAAVSLARLRRDQGRAAEGSGLLASVYGRFTEGFEMPDLKEARALLEGLDE